MSEKRRSYMAVFAALLIVLFGLLLLCSQRAALNEGQDLNTEDDQFRQELLDMLDLADESADQSTPDAGEQSQETADDVLSLLIPESEEATTTSLESKPTTTADNMGLSEDMFVQVQNEVGRLEKVLEKRSQAVDSLRRIIENKNARIQELEARVAQAKSSSGYQASYSPPAASSASSGYASSAPAGSPFMVAYHAARQQFENFDYTGAIESFERLLAEYPNHSMADNCQYWIGECYYGLKQYQKAILEFQKVFAYAQADKHDDAQLMIGLCYVKLGQPDRARAEFETFLNTYAGSEYVNIARRYYQNI